MVTTEHPDVLVQNRAERSRYEATVDGTVVGIADYRTDGDRVVFPHVEVEPRWEGQGIASALVRQALDDVIADGKRITPLCPFVVDYVDRRPDYQEHTG